MCSVWVTFNFHVNRRENGFGVFLYLNQCIALAHMVNFLSKLIFCFGVCVHMLPHLLKSVQVIYTLYCRILPPDKFNADLHFSCRLTCSNPVFQEWAWEGLVWQKRCTNTAVLLSLSRSGTSRLHSCGLFRSPCSGILPSSQPGLNVPAVEQFCMQIGEFHWCPG